MSRSDDGEVPPVECRDFGDGEAFRDRDDGCVRGAEREVGVLFDQVGHACVVGRASSAGTRSPLAMLRRNIDSTRPPASRPSR
jgi:hypothetical protein